MNTRQLLQSLLAFAVGLCTAVLPIAAQSAGELDRQAIVTAIPFGHPIWKPVDVHVFAAPIGTAGDGYAGFAHTAQILLPPPNHVLHPQLLIGPGTPHGAPYDSEIDEGVDHAGFHEGALFGTSEFANGMGVYLAWMTVPAPGVRGSSPDFRSGRIIPNSLFPIHVAGTALRNGALYDPYIGTFDVPAINDPGLTPSYNVDGHSHFPLIYADNSDFGPPGTSLSGLYAYDVVMTDRTGSGWHIRAHFVVSRAVDNPVR